MLRRTARYTEDLHDVWAYIARDNLLAADLVIQQIEARVTPLATYPELGEQQPQFGDEVRRITIGSYLLYYEYHPDVVTVLRVLHAARRIEDLGTQ
ncbi:Plasmid stabilization system protein [Posidoniimonas corsicana]|uniref:Plasmid stabilization system protein n=1 Tax=Posidoniimonas corsicana TaxID=1938618 RepID=A0A5C5VH08_9BACT|nr:type II toxin-antitoxin system RelE/ParE family toxin [Posidoniimonas corsicana]TWT37886.1 Plasmid stabilization system protein [Posidoniimonas corsicana]